MFVVQKKEVMYLSTQHLSPYPKTSISASQLITSDTHSVIAIAGAKPRESDESYCNVTLSNLVEHATGMKHLDKLRQKMIDLDNKVTVRHDGKYSEIAEGVEKFMLYICCKLKDKGNIIIPRRTGSLYAGLKVGLPLETDYVFEIVDVNGTDFEFRDFVSQIRSYIDEYNFFKYKNTCFKIIEKKETRVSYCVTLECRDKNNEMREGFSIDIVPRRKTCDNDICKLRYTEDASNFIQSHHMEDTVYPITLLSTRRDCRCDLGLLKHTILKSLNENTKRELRIAKYIFTSALLPSKKPLTDADNLDKIDRQRLFGHSLSISSSFHVGTCFLHILIAAHKSNRVKMLKNGLLMICTLELLKRTFEFFTSVKKGINIFVSDPFSADVQYSNHLDVERDLFHTCAELIDIKLDTFLKRRSLDEFNLRVFEETDTECDRYGYLKI